MSLGYLIKRGGLRGLATAIPANLATDETLNTSSVAGAATVAVATQPPTVTALLDAAMQACGYWDDGEAARQTMREQCLSVPEHLRKELTEHFLKAYPTRRLGAGKLINL